MSDATLTDKQLQIMDCVFKGNPDGSFLDIDQLMIAMGHTATKQAMQCSLNVLEKHGMLEREWQKRRFAKRRVVKPTPKAFDILRGKR